MGDWLQEVAIYAEGEESWLIQVTIHYSLWETCIPSRWELVYCQVVLRNRKIHGLGLLVKQKPICVTEWYWFNTLWWNRSGRKKVSPRAGKHLRYGGRNMCFNRRRPPTWFKARMSPRAKVFLSEPKRSRELMRRILDGETHITIDGYKFRTYPLPQEESPPKRTFWNKLRDLINLHR